MDREEAKRNISLVTGCSAKEIEDGIDKIERINSPQSIPLTCFPDLCPKEPLPKPLTPKQYGQSLLIRKKKRK